MLSSLKSKLNYPLIGVLAITFIAAFFSEGFFHPDEHFSTIELMHRKFNPNLGADIFGWDFSLAIRSYFQPFIYFTLLAPFRFLGLTDPFWQAFILRLFQGSFFLIGLNFFLKNKLAEWSSKDRLELMLMTLATWYVPYLIVRTSSESLSTSLFLFALASSYSAREKGIWTGALAGFSFLARFQMGIPVLFLFLWKWLVGRKSWSNLVQYCFGVLLALVALVLIDRWGYGEWVFSPWNYFNENIVKSRASEFGVDPWYYYFKAVLMKGALPISLPLLASCLFYFYWQRKSLLTWVLVPFILIHFLIGHKEWRFLTFAYLLAPVMAVLVWNHFGEKWKNKLAEKRWPFWLAAFVLLINFALLFKVCFSRAHSPLGIYKILHRQLDPNIQLYTLGNKDGKPALDLMLRFYARHPRQIKTIDPEQLQSSPKPFYLLTSTYAEKVAMEAYDFCSKKAGLYPDWLLQYNVFKWRDRSAIWNLYHCL